MFKECQKSVKEVSKPCKIKVKYLLFAYCMKYNTIISYIVLILVASFTSCNSNQDEFTRQTKIALRDAGNKLLLSENDSTSLILPIKALNHNQYQLSFSKPLVIEPSILVDVIDTSFKTFNLPRHYIVEVIQCKANEVAYSYQMSKTTESTIIPCGGRYLPLGCYTIEINFLETATNDKRLNLLIGFLVALLVIIISIFLHRKKLKKQLIKTPVNYEAIGSFKFYPEQNKLIKEAEEIALSKKECELLALLVERPNQVIKRDELTKKVWEDNGVFVGRSLDTYISKLRKKLKSDTSLKITNVHGVGYKLEIL